MSPATLTTSVTQYSYELADGNNLGTLQLQFVK